MGHSIYTEILDELPGAGRLGRHVELDSRSLQYAVPPSAVANVEHDVHCDTLDQGDVGSCTGNGETYALACSPLFDALPVGHPALDEQEALTLYEAATRLDNVAGSYPPDDTGSTGLAVCKAAKNAGLIGGYQAALGIDAALTALQSGPVIFGIPWLASMDHPDANGLVTVDPSSGVRGGHEVCAYGYRDGRLLMLQSWGPSWGDQGRWQIAAQDMGMLLSQQGDAYAPLPAGVSPTPNPTPTPGRHYTDAGLWSQYTVVKASIDAFDQYITGWKPGHVR